MACNLVLLRLVCTVHLEFITQVEGSERKYSSLAHINYLSHFKGVYVSIYYSRELKILLDPGQPQLVLYIPLPLPFPDFGLLGGRMPFPPCSSYFMSTFCCPIIKSISYRHGRHMPEF